MALTDNAAGFWDLDNDSNDDSGNGNNGSDTSMSYDGTYGVFSGSGFITLPSGLVSTSGPLTWTGWFNATAAASYLVAWMFGGTSSGSGIGCAPATAESKAYSAYPQAFAGTITTSTLYHVVTTWDGSTVKLYLNGSIGTNGIAVPSNGDAAIGKSSGWTNFSGSIRCVGLFSDCKDATWVASLYNAGTPLKWAGMSPAGGLLLKRRRAYP